MDKRYAPDLGALADRAERFALLAHQKGPSAPEYWVACELLEEAIAATRAAIATAEGRS